MKQLADLPTEIPLFPLPGALLMPRARLPLHIFEPRYLAMLDDALKTESRLIGMIQPRPKEGDGLFGRIGCAGRVTAFSETEDGRYMVTLTGISRFGVVDITQGFLPYIKTKANWQGFESDLGAAEKDEALDRATFLELLERYFLSRDLKTDWDSLKDAEDELLINSLAMLCPFDPEDKQALLEAPNLVTRRETLVALMEYALRSGGNEGMMQ